MNIIFKQYESLHNLVQALPGAPCYSATTESRPEWYGTASYEEAVELMLNGDARLAKQIRSAAGLNMRQPMTATRPKFVPAVAGFMPHVPNYVAGIPQSMVAAVMQPTTPKVLTIYYGVNTWGDVKFEDIEKVSARIVSAIDSIERTGVRVNLYAVNCASAYIRRNKKRVLELEYACFTVNLKKSGEKFDAYKCAFPLLSASFNRRIAFNWRNKVARWGSCMGGSIYGEKLRTVLRQCGVKFDVALSYYDVCEISTRAELEQLLVNNQ